MKTMQKIMFMFVFLMLAANSVFAETKSDGEPKKDPPKDIVIPLPGAGADVVIEVPYFVEEVRKLPPAKTTVIHKGNDLLLRGGLIVGTGFLGRSYPATTAGLVAEIGRTDSAWKLHANFRAGSCKKGWGDVAIDSGLAAMRSFNKHLSVGVGGDLLYCTEVLGHPKEQAGERIVGGSLLVNVEFAHHFVVGGSIGAGAATVPTPGDRDTQAVLYGGVNVSYLWGR